MKYDVIDPLKSQKGFTIMELVVGMVILIITLGAIYGIFASSLRSYQYNFQATANMQEERQILLRITDEIKNAVQITSPALGTTTGTFSYKRSGDSTDRTISLDTDTHTIFLTDSLGKTVKLGAGRATSIQFIRDNTLSQKVTITLTMNNSAVINSPRNTISTIVYTLN